MIVHEGMNAYPQLKYLILIIGRNCMTNELFLFHIDQLEDVLLLHGFSR